MSLCVGCFSPSDRFVNYLRAFIKNGPPGYAPYCEGRLNRTHRNGARSQPPSFLEMQASRNKDPITIEVALMTKATHTIQIDSASTAEEVCANVAKTLGLHDKYGFSLYVAIFNTVMSLGSESDHVLDAVSQCEQYAKEQGKLEKDAPWKMYFRKEMFAPWHNPESDAVATDLIYHQIVSGLKHGEYRSKNDADTAALIAQRYYVEHGIPMDSQKLHSQIGEYLPAHLVLNAADASVKAWEARIVDAFARCSAVKNRKPAVKAKEDIVKYAKVTWPLLFSKFYETLQTGGPQLSKKSIIVAVNWTGVFMIDDHEQILLELAFPDLAHVEAQPGKETFLLRTIGGDEYAFRSPDAANVVRVVLQLLDGLKKRSVYVVAIQDYKHPGEASSFLVLKKGDLVTLKNGLNGEQLMTATWGYGESNGKLGDFPTECIHIIPTMHQPPVYVLNAFKKDRPLLKQTASDSATTMNTVQRMRLYTLASYASEHFRAGRRPMTKQTSVITTAKRDGTEEMWKYTNEPIWQPLHRNLLENEELSKLSCSAFTAILKYMGDLPAPKPKIPNELTDEIFGGALQHGQLKDEVYCQIMRQLTHNRLNLSEERGWELLYLATGSFGCSQVLAGELRKFLESRTHPLAESCLQRFGRVQKTGDRHRAPYAIEVEAIQMRSLEIYHKVYFPDDTDEAFEIDSLTRASELCDTIARRHELVSSDGFSLFVVIGDKVLSMPRDQFFYDYMHDLFEYIRSTKPNWNCKYYANIPVETIHSSVAFSAAAPIQAQYQIFFMKKLWIDTIPGRDVNADQMFHYHQELPKYLRGYHKCTKQEAVKLAALVLRIKFKGESLAALPNVLKEIIPSDLIRIQNSADWRKSVAAAFSTDGKMTPSEAKTKFLQIVSQWVTFASTFFEVKQNSEPTYPEVVIIAINKNGINIIHPQTKVQLKCFDF